MTKTRTNNNHNGKNATYLLDIDKQHYDVDKLKCQKVLIFFSKSHSVNSGHICFITVPSLVNSFANTRM